MKDYKLPLPRMCLVIICWSEQFSFQVLLFSIHLCSLCQISEMEEFLTNQGSPCHIIWTSSNTARTVNVDPCDIQDSRGSVHHLQDKKVFIKKRSFVYRLGCYPRSKKLMDIATFALNHRLNGRGLYFTSTCPGLVMSQMTWALLPRFVWYLLFPLLFLVS